MKPHLHQATVLGLVCWLAAGFALAAEADAGAAGAGAEPAGEETFLTASELLTLCRSEAGSAGEGQCLEFIFGLAQTVTAMQQEDPSVQYFCIDPQATAIQVVQRALVEGIAANPAGGARPAYEVAIEVLGREWPCMRFDAL